MAEAFTIIRPHHGNMTLRKRLAPLHPRFDIEMSDGAPLTLTGNVSAHAFTLALQAAESK